MSLEIKIDGSTLSDAVGKYINKEFFNMKTGYVDTIIEARMKDDKVKADMLNEKPS
ncbi:hypothetical protein HF569_10215 [Lactobacillus sp. ZJLC3-7]|nr:hypothetical protein [Levilactobacillus tujiorum]